MHKYEEEDISKVALLPYSWGKIENKSILVSGGTGLIGSFFCEVIKYRNIHCNSNIKVISLSRSGGESSNGVFNIACDITGKIDINEHVDYIMHLASNTHPDAYEKDPIGTIMTNVLGCDNLLKIAVNNKCEKFILASSVEIYGACGNQELKENMNGYLPLDTYRSGYNEAKKVSELLCHSYKKKYDIDFSIARLPRVFGVDKRNDSKAMAQFIRNAANKNNIVLHSEGNQKFSFSYVADVASGLIKLLIDGKSGEAYNISEDNENMTLYDYAVYLANLSGVKVIKDIKHSDAVSAAQNALLDTSKIKSIGWKPLYTVSEALKRVYTIKKELNN